MPSTPAPPRQFHIAVLLLPPIQLLDLASIDLFHMLTPSYLTACNLPAPLLAGGIDMKITYVAASASTSTFTTDPTSTSSSGKTEEKGTGIRIAELTASAGLRIDVDISDESVKPGAIDALLIPGPDPSTVVSEDVKTFIQRHFKSSTTILSVCTGIFIVGQAGILNGKKVTGPRALLPELRKRFPGAEWCERRWMKDTVGTKDTSAGTKEGELWTSAGITNGLDMVAGFLRERWGGPTVECVLEMADVGGRGVEYE